MKLNGLVTTPPLPALLLSAALLVLSSCAQSPGPATAPTSKPVPGEMTTVNVLLPCLNTRTPERYFQGEPMIKVLDYFGESWTINDPELGESQVAQPLCLLKLDVGTKDNTLQLARAKVRELTGTAPKAVSLESNVYTDPTDHVFDADCDSYYKLIEASVGARPISKDKLRTLLGVDQDDQTGEGATIAILDSGVADPGAFAASSRPSSFSRAFEGNPGDLRDRFECALSVPTVPKDERKDVRFDFGSESSPLLLGYNRVAQDTTTGEFYWTDTDGLDSRDRGLGVDEINRDLIFSDAPKTFEAKVPNGKWNVSVTFGDKFHAHDAMRVKAEGKLKASGVTTRAGEFTDEDFGVTVRDGALTLEFSDEGGANPHWTVTRVVLSPDKSATSTIIDGHGMHVVDLVSTVAPRAETMMLKVCGKDGACATSAVAKALLYLANRYEGLPEVDVVNMSFGGNGGADGGVLHTLLVTMTETLPETLLVSSLGNEPEDPMHYPADYTDLYHSLVPVAAAKIDIITGEWQLASFNRDGMIRNDMYAPIAAPGVALRGLDGNALGTGTSFAAPIVSAVAVLERQQAPEANRSARSLLRSLQDSSDDRKGFRFLQGK